MYTVDEPGEKKYPACRAAYDEVHSLAPDVRFLVTVNRAAALALEDKIDIFCPILRAFDAAFCRETHRKGKDVWWYTCLYPREPYPTYQIDGVGIGQRILGWLQAKYQVRGNLYWAVNIWRKHNNKGAIWYTKELRDLWNNPSAFPNSNGDGYLIYPAENPEDDPIPTIRLELIRQGNEDIDTLDLLKRAIRGSAAKLGVEYSAEERVFELVNRVAPELTDFTKDPEALARLRRDVLDELDTLERGPVALLACDRPEGKLRRNTVLHYRLFAAKGSKVVVLPATEVKEEKDGFSFSLAPAPGPLSVTVTLTAPDGGTALLKRQYCVMEKEDLALEVFSWSDKSFQKSLTCKKVTLWQVPGSPVNGFLYEKDVPYPNVRFRADGDTSPYRWLKMTLENPMPTTASLVMKYHSDDGGKQDGNGISLRPGERKTMVFAFNPEGRTADSAFNVIELWMHKKPMERKLIVDSVSLHTERPEAE